MKKNMDKKHPAWKEFYERLDGKEGCNFRKDNNGEIIWNCKGGRNKELAIAIMEKICNIDIKRSIEYFNKNGGYCDCEIIFNVA